MSLLLRIGANAARRIIRPSVRAFCDKTEDKTERLKAADPIEHATGFEKQLRMFEEKGITDPFFMEPIKRGPSSRENPLLVPSFEDKRLVGCVCEEDATFINWMWVHQEEPRRCECGYWFQCVDAYDHFKELTE